MSDLISRQDAINCFWDKERCFRDALDVIKDIRQLPSAQENYDTEMKQEFIRMAEYIDCLLQCSDEQKETLLGFISRLADYMPWTERD